MIHLAILGNIFPPVCLMARSVLSNWTEKFPLGAKPQHGNHIIGRWGFGPLNFFILKNRNLKFLWVGKSSQKPGNCNGHLFFFFFPLTPVFGKKESAPYISKNKRPCSHRDGAESTGMFCVALQPQSIQLHQERNRIVQTFRGERCLACLTRFLFFFEGWGFSSFITAAHSSFIETIEKRWSRDPKDETR